MPNPMEGWGAHRMTSDNPEQARESKRTAHNSEEDADLEAGGFASIAEDAGQEGGLEMDSAKLAKVSNHFRQSVRLLSSSIPKPRRVPSFLSLRVSDLAVVPRDCNLLRWLTRAALALLWGPRPPAAALPARANGLTLPSSSGRSRIPDGRFKG